MLKPQTRLWIDSDITLGQKNSPVSSCDVDDGYAIAALLRSVEVDVLGISTTLGNTDNIAVSTAVATDFIQRFGPNSVAVTQGASCSLDQQPEQAAPEGVQAMAAALTEGRMSIIGIGAATNIALLLEHYPQLVGNIDELILLAGRRSIEQHFISGHHQAKPFRDLNFEADVSAYQRILASELAITLVPYEACRQFWIKPHDLLAMRHTSQVADYLAKKSEPWLVEWEVVFGAAGFNPFDLIAAAYVIDSSWFRTELWNVVIEQGPSDTDKGQNKDYLICSELVNSGRQVRYCTAIAPQSKPILLERIKAHDMQHFILGMSHINIIVDDIAKASDFYYRSLGFEIAKDPQGQLMDYKNVSMRSFALDAGLTDGKVDVDVRFLKHPQAGLYLELMLYREPQGSQQLPPQAKTYDLGGPRHVAMEVSNCNEVFNYLKQQAGVTMINPSDDYHPDKLDGFPISFFYWIDPYGVQWEMEEGRQMSLSRSII